MSETPPEDARPEPYHNEDYPDFPPESDAPLPPGWQLVHNGTGETELLVEPDTFTDGEDSE